MSTPTACVAPPQLAFTTAKSDSLNGIVLDVAGYAGGTSNIVNPDIVAKQLQFE